MERKKVKGLVLEKSGENIILLTREGEYLKVPEKGQSFLPGLEVEVEVEVPPKKKPFFLLPAAGMVAALLIFLVFSLVQPAGAIPEAYLALDINPSILLSLDENARIIEGEGLNEGGERILEILEIEGAGVFEALDLTLEAAHQGDYLSRERDNLIILSLAASENYGLGEEDLRASLSQKLSKMDLQAYLKINMAGMDKAQKAKEMSVSLNALMLGEQMRERAEEDPVPFEGSPPLPVREFLKQVNPADIFQEDEFVPGEKGKGERKPDVPPIPKIPPESRQERVEDKDEGTSGEGKEPSPDLDQEKPSEAPQIPDTPGEDKFPQNTGEETPAPGGV